MTGPQLSKYVCPTSWKVVIQVSGVQARCCSVNLARLLAGKGVPLFDSPLLEYFLLNVLSLSAQESLKGVALRFGRGHLLGIGGSRMLSDCVRCIELS